MASRKRDLLSRYKSLYVKSIVGIYIPVEFRQSWSALTRKKESGLLSEEEIRELEEIEQYRMDIVARKLSAAEYDDIQRKMADVRKKRFSEEITEEAIGEEVSRLQGNISGNAGLSEYIPESLEEQLNTSVGDALMGNWEGALLIASVLHPDDLKEALVRACLLSTLQDESQIRIEDSDVRLTPDENAELYPDEVDSLDPDYEEEMEKRRQEIYAEHKAKMHEEKEAECARARAKLNALSVDDLWRKCAKGSLQSAIYRELSEESTIRLLHTEMVDPEKKRTEAQRRKYGGVDARAPMFSEKELRDIRDELPDLWAFLLELHEDLNAISTVSEAREMCRFNPFRRTTVSYDRGGIPNDDSNSPQGHGDASMGSDDGHTGASPDVDEGEDSGHGDNGSGLRLTPVEEDPRVEQRLADVDQLEES